MACRERRAVAIFQTSWRTLQQNLTNKCSARSCSHTTHPSSHSNRNYIQQQLLVECKKDQWLHSQSPQTVCGQRGPGPGAETTMDPPSSAISPGTNTNQQPELTRENQEIQQDQLLWPGQCNGLMSGSVQSWSHSLPWNSSSPTFKFHPLTAIFISFLLQAPPSDNLSGVVSLAPKGTAMSGSK